MLRIPSSATIIPFEQDFQAWRECWVRQVFKDPEAPNAVKAIASFVSFYLNRQSRPCYSLLRNNRESAVCKRKYEMVGERSHLRESPDPSNPTSTLWGQGVSNS
jgi:hypothetical protein